MCCVGGEWEFLMMLLQTDGPSRLESVFVGLLEVASRRERVFGLLLVMVLVVGSIIGIGVFIMFVVMVGVGISSIIMLGVIVFGAVLFGVLFG